MKTLDQLRSDGYILCLPQRTKLDTGIINKLQCRLKCPLESKIILHVVSAYDYLVRGISIVDDNGELVTSLDEVLEKKLVIAGRILTFGMLYNNLQSGMRRLALKWSPIGA